MTENRVPPDDEPLVLGDKFVIPADAVQWLDPSMFPPVGSPSTPPIQFGPSYDDVEEVDEDVPEEFETLPNDAKPVARSVVDDTNLPEGWERLPDVAPPVGWSVVPVDRRHEDPSH